MGKTARLSAVRLRRIDWVWSGSVFLKAATAEMHGGIIVAKKVSIDTVLNL